MKKWKAKQCQAEEKGEKFKKQMGNCEDVHIKKHAQTVSEIMQKSLLIWV